MKGCCLVFADDMNTSFSYNLAGIRDMSGGNDLQSQRKYGRPEMFDYEGLMMLLMNDSPAFHGNVPMTEPDFLRMGGMQFQKTFEVASTDVKNAIKDKVYFAEFWWVAFCFWACHLPRSTATKLLPYT